ncbi:hypothetical protein P691DRAFT_794702 [Macrolepiota fuliginosa MF-IS2]|uniref:RING-type domain-containing protein n=1 Tax=Macrolepiota fuliginosa MF-IS2 TaxID=1400762 RepID=A0A9P5XKF0_9AGAR|nr:hypothetical protein P691DRAFT_794702 [Macrolepiota fuliginosa MF-IS2]
MSEDEFDVLPDLFSGISEADWSRILDQTVITREGSDGQHLWQPEQDVPPHASPVGSSGSTDYGDDSSMNAEVLAELDRIEVDALQIHGESSSTTHGAAHQATTSRHDGSLSNNDMGHVEPPVIESTRLPAKRPRSETSDSEHKKGKMRDDSVVQRLIEAYEEELTCPILATHVGNPCGHSYCGDCGWQWIKKNKRGQCPVCRAKLIKSEPLVPNITMDSLVEKHIGLLISAGDEEWKPHGVKYKEWDVRKEKWKASAGTRIRTKRARRTEIQTIVVDELPVGPMGDPLLLANDDPYVEDSSQEQAQVEPTRFRSDRQLRNGRGRRR